VSFTDAHPQTRVRLPAEPPGSHDQKWSRRRLVVVGVGVLLVAIVTVVVATRHHPSTTTTPNARAASPPVTAAAVPTTVDGVAVGYPDTEAGAEAAAGNYVVAFAGQGMFNTTTRHTIIHAVADPAVIAELQQQYDAAFQATMSRFGLNAAGRPPRGQQFVARALPAGVHIDSYAAATASVSVWSDGLIGLAGAQSTNPVEEAWTTTTVSLRWADGDWKWVTATQHDGPTPLAGLQSPSTSAAIAQAVQSFNGMRYEP
jgi:hypothetical protein